MIIIPPNLSCSAQKRALYAIDPYFRDAWDDCLATWGHDQAIARLFSLTPVVCRPDAFLVRGVRRCLDILYQRGLIPLAHKTFRYSRLTVRELWRYQLNIAHADRLDVMDMFLPSLDSLYVLLQERDIEDFVPATTRLSNDKGPSRPQDRQPHHLRSMIAPTQVSVFTYVHIADEPADIVRELGIFFDRTERINLLRALDDGGDATTAIDRTVAELYDMMPAHDLDTSGALNRISEAVHETYRRRATMKLAVRDQLLELCDIVRSGGRVWRQLFALADSNNVHINHWDRVAVAGDRHDRHIDGLPILPDVRMSDWQTITPPQQATTQRPTATDEIATPHTRAAYA